MGALHHHEEHERTRSRMCCCEARDDMGRRACVCVCVFVWPPLHNNKGPERGGVECGSHHHQHITIRPQEELLYIRTVKAGGDVAAAVAVRGDVLITAAAVEVCTYVSILLLLLLPFVEMF